MNTRANEGWEPVYTYKIDPADLRECCARYPPWRSLPHSAGSAPKLSLPSFACSYTAESAHSPSRVHCSLYSRFTPLISSHSSSHSSSPSPLLPCSFLLHHHLHPASTPPSSPSAAQSSPSLSSPAHRPSTPSSRGQSPSSSPLAAQWPSPASGSAAGRRSEGQAPPLQGIGRSWVG